MNIFSERLKNALSERGMKQTELSERTGISKSSISEWLNGRYEAKADKIVLIAKALNVNESYLIGLDVPMENEVEQSSTKTILDNIFNKLEKPRQDKVVSYAKSELDEQNKVVEIADYQIEKEYPYYDDAVSAGTGQYIGTSQRETITLPVEFDADYVVPVYGDSMEPEYHDGDYIFVESTVNVSDGEVGVFEYYGATYVKQLILEDDHAYLHSFNQNGDYEDMKVDADSDFRVLGRVVGRYSE